MLKNAYNTGASNLSKENFVLNILHQDVENSVFSHTLSRHKNEQIRKKSINNLTKIDQLNGQNLKTQTGDGLFDFIKTITVIPETGTIFLPTLEPFGRDLQKTIGNENEFLFTELYTKTQNQNPK